MFLNASAFINTTALETDADSQQQKKCYGQI